MVAAWKLAPDRRSAEQKILDSLVDVEQAIREKSPRRCLKVVSDSYSDPVAGSKHELRQLVIAGCREPGLFEIVLQPDRPVVRGTEAEVAIRVDFSITRGPMVQRVPPFEVQTRWVQEKGKWKVVEARGYMDAEDAFIESL